MSEPAARRVLRELTPPILWRSAGRLTRSLSRSDPEAPATRVGLRGLDTRLEAHLDTSAPGYFVELGANDGIDQSNTYFLEREFGWRGLLIEPSLNRYLELIANRDAANSFACAACVPFGYDGEFVRLTYANLMTTSRSLPTDLDDAEEHIVAGTRFLPSEAQVVDFGAIARTLDSLLEEARSPRRIDLLSLDVEGAEAAVLRGIDHEKYRFHRLLVECRSIDALAIYLEDLGYSLRAELSAHDYLFADTTRRTPQPSRSSA